jgi:general secretion pathway protein M
MPLSRDAQRLCALALAAGVLALACMGLHGWFVAPLQRIAEEEQLMQLAHQRFARLVAQREAIKAQLEAAGERSVAEDGLLSGRAPEAAQAQSMQLVVDRLALQPASGPPCSVLNRSPGPLQAQGQLLRITLDVQLECGAEALASTLHRLESERPYLQVQALSVRRQGPMRMDGEAASGLLSVQVQLAGYLRGGEGGEHD